MANENDKNLNNAADKAPKKKLNVVFRKQNSTTIKELPKHLKTAASASEKRGKSTGEESKDAGARRARPLPAGTKPVKPAAMSGLRTAEPEVKKEKLTKVLPEEPKAAPAEVKAELETEPKAEVLAEAEATASKTVEENAPEVTAEETKAPAETAVEETKAPAETAPEETKAPVETPAKETKTSAVTPPSTKAEEGLPKVRIVKSYADYDAAKVIKEASNARKRAESSTGGARPARGESGKRSGAGTTSTRAARGEAPGRGADQGTQTQKGSRSKGGERRGASSSGSGRGDAPQRANQNQRGKSSAKGQRADKRKDKYSDDLSTIKKNKKGAFIKPEPKKEQPEEEIKVITIPESLSIKELAEKLRLQPGVIVKKLFLEGQMVTPNTDISYEEAENIAMDYDILCEREVEVDVIAELLKDDEDDETKLITRNPVVCVMGHVDHGKTSLLDAIRNTNVTSHEAGGITQHIGASVVKVGDRCITFLDTPGHEAFTAMRLRGAQSTDIAVLVVAADDGVKPQTVEAINHAKAAEVEVIVAINKMDKEGANPDMVRNELSEYGLISEDWGGSTPMVELSARTGDGIADLLDTILIEADVMELKADPDRLARGLVIEAELDKGRGPVATVLVQKGTLHVGDSVVAGSSFGKVRAMFDDKQRQIKGASPSYPAEILGLNDVPEAGEVFMAVKDEKEARAIAETFIAEHKKHMLDETRKKMNLEDLFEEIQAGNVKELPIIVKADVQGSVEAVKQSLGKLSNEEVSVNVIHAAVGNINESDVSLASASNAIIIGFNVKPDNQAKQAAEQEKVDMRLYRVIYQAIEDIEAALTGMLAPVYEAQTTGHVIVRQIFTSSGVGTIAGSYVTDGVVERGSKARLYRSNKLLFDGDIASLKRFKDEVKEVKLGFECGIVLDDWSDIEVDDTMEIYKMVQVPRS